MEQEQIPGYKFNSINKNVIFYTIIYNDELVENSSYSYTCAHTHTHSKQNPTLYISVD